jgi:hypothetical protein
MSPEAGPVVLSDPLEQASMAAAAIPPTQRRPVMSFIPMKMAQ